MSSYGHDDEIWLVERILKARQERRHSLTDKCMIRSDRMQPETDNNEFQVSGTMLLFNCPFVKLP
jgi:hypothetical protein